MANIRRGPTGCCGGTAGGDKLLAYWLWDTMLADGKSFVSEVTRYVDNLQGYIRLKKLVPTENYVRD